MVGEVLHSIRSELAREVTTAFLTYRERHIVNWSYAFLLHKESISLGKGGSP